MHSWPIVLPLMQHRGDAHACLLQSIHSRGGVTPPPLTDCFLLSLLLNYFSSDSHMWVFSSLAGRLTLWRREAEAQLTGGARKTRRVFCQRQRKTGAHSVLDAGEILAPPVVFLLNSLSCSAPPPPAPTAGQIKMQHQFIIPAILLSLPSSPTKT